MNSLHSRFLKQLIPEQPFPCNDKFIMFRQSDHFRDLNFPSIISNNLQTGELTDIPDTDVSFLVNGDADRATSEEFAGDYRTVVAL